MAFNPALVPSTISMRSAGSAPALGDSQYQRSKYLRERRDSAIKSGADLAANSKPIDDPDFRAATANAGGSGLAPEGSELNMAERLLQRFAFQQVVMQCMAEQRLDALAYPTMNIPPLKIQAPEETPVNGRNVYHWTLLGQQGFPAMTVPAGFTTHVYDRVRDAASPGGTRLVGPTAARLPVGIDFAGRPFSEPLLLRIAAAYEASTTHRVPPAEFGPVTPTLTSLKTEH
jgi:amidase